MTQPTSFTNVPPCPNQPDGLPTRCPECKCFLSARGWVDEIGFDVIEVNGRDREVSVRMHMNTCANCGFVLVIDE